MRVRGFSRLYWGFVFIMLGFRIQGFDILPDIIGYLFFASGLRNLCSESLYFEKAYQYNIPMIFLSVLTIYQPQNQVSGGGIQFGPFGVFGLLFWIASFILNLVVVYHLFLGIREMAQKQDRPEIAADSDLKWRHFKMLQIGVLFSFLLIFIPPLALGYIFALLIISFVVLRDILKLINQCKAELL